MPPAQSAYRWRGKRNTPKGADAGLVYARQETIDRFDLRGLRKGGRAAQHSKQAKKGNFRHGKCRLLVDRLAPASRLPGKLNVVYPVVFS